MNWSALFVYRDGFLYWKTPGPGRQMDKPAGSIRQDGYHAINVGKKKYRAHRIIWEIHNGPIPEGLVVDHIDSNPGNNMIENLRLASIARNNTRSFSNSKHGWKGVQARANGKFQAVLQLGHVTIGLGVFDEVEDAAQTYNFVAAEWFGPYARFNEAEQPWLAPSLEPEKSEQVS